MLTKNVFVLVLFISLVFISCNTQEKLYNTFDQSKLIKVGYGPEDINLDTIQGNRLIIACGEHQDKSIQGSIWAYELDNNEVQEFSITPKLDFYFQPHGIYILNENDTTFLFVINHVSKRKTEIDRFVLEKNHLILDKRFTNITGNPNDLFAISKNEFYYSDYKIFGGSIIHYNSFATKIVKHLNMPNGVFIENDILFFSTTLFGKFFKVDLLTNKKKKLSNLKGGDNLMSYSNDELLATSHSNSFKFTLHAINNEKPSPSLVYRVNKTTGRKIVFYYDDGKQISAVSTAIFYDNKLYLGQIFENYILVLE